MSNLNRKAIARSYHDRKTQTAVMLTIINAGCLAWLGYLIFMTAYFYDNPMLFTYNPIYALTFYIPPEGWDINLPWLFFIICVMAVLASFLGARIYLKHSKAKIRQYALLGLFSTLLLGYSYTLCWLETWVYEDSYAAIERRENELNKRYNGKNLSEGLKAWRQSEFDKLSRLKKFQQEYKR